MGHSKFFKFLFIIPLLILTSALDDQSGFHGSERDALFMIKAAFNNPVLNANWTGGIMCYMNKPPNWYGVQCSNGRVTGLILESIGLTGQIKASALANLTELVTISFRNNSVTGNMMDFTYTQKLKSIDLSQNNLDGEISPSLVNLNALESLQLQGNNLSGPIPYFNQSTLKAFNVSNNNLTGSIPETKTLQSFGPSSYSGNENLCGSPTPRPCKSRNISSKESNGQDSSKKKDGINSHLVLILVVSNVVVLIIILLLFIIYYKRYKKLKSKMKSNFVGADEEHNSKEKVMAIEGGDNKGKLVFMEQDGCATFELDDLLKASAEGLGKGNFGNCYKAMLEMGEAVVVKRLRDLKPLNSEEFVRQVRAIADQKHPNLLPLMAFFYSKDEKLFLYKLASHGNLHNRLHGGRGTRDRIPFRWSSRLVVARGVARALNHLHQNTRSQTTAPHGNLKSSNVLFHDTDEVLVSDYGLTSLIALPIVVQRMVAYKCPEYQSHKKITKKSDVWSYGVLLLELLTGRIPAHSAPPGTNGADLCSWVHRAVREEWTAEIFDTEIAVQRGANQGMLRLMQIAIKCCEKLPEKRPEMGEVVAEVEEIKVSVDSEDEEYSHSSVDRSLTDDSLSGPTGSLVIAGD